MSQVPLWFERKFDFSFPVEVYPNVAARLRGTPARLEEMVRDHASETLIRKDSGKWSAQEHAGHLLDLERLWTARVNDFAKGGSELTVADLTNRGTTQANHTDSRRLSQGQSGVATSRRRTRSRPFRPHAASSAHENADAVG